MDLEEIKNLYELCTSGDGNYDVAAACLLVDEVPDLVRQIEMLEDKLDGATFDFYEPPVPKKIIKIINVPVRYGGKLEAREERGGR